MNTEEAGEFLEKMRKEKVKKLTDVGFTKEYETERENKHMSQKENEWEKRFDDMNRRCDGEYGTGQFPPEVKRFFIESIDTEVSNREKEIAEEVEKIIQEEKKYRASTYGLSKVLSILKHQ
jgi:hypothetical protein